MQLLLCKKFNLKRESKLIERDIIGIFISRENNKKDRDQNAALESQNRGIKSFDLKIGLISWLFVSLYGIFINSFCVSRLITVEAVIRMVW